MKVITWSTAKKLGLPTYFTGKPCKRGSIAGRITVSGNCLCDLCAAARAKSHRKTVMRAFYRNPERWREKNRKYKRDNPGANRARQAKRKAETKRRIPSWYGEFDEFVMLEAASLAALRAETTGIEWHIDHMVPLQGRKASGLHCGHNIQVIPRYLNERKHNKLWLHEPDQWLEALHREQCK